MNTLNKLNFSVLNTSNIIEQRACIATCLMLSSCILDVSFVKINLMNYWMNTLNMFSVNFFL